MIRMPNRMMEEKPVVFMLEAAAVCNRSCEFCGIVTTPVDEIDDPFMDVNLAEDIAENMEWAAPLRIQLKGNGEPLLHPNYLEFIEAVRKQRSESQITTYTNGDPIRNGKYTIDELFDAGLNLLVLDSYDEESKEWSKSWTRK